MKTMCKNYVNNDIRKIAILIKEQHLCISGFLSSFGFSSKGRILSTILIYNRLLSIRFSLLVIQNFDSDLFCPNKLYSIKEYFVVKFIYKLITLFMFLN